MSKLDVDTISIYKGKDDIFNLHSDRISIWGNRRGMTFPLVYIKDIPPEVWEVWIIQYFNTSVGSFIANKCNETIKKYPEYFK